MPRASLFFVLLAAANSLGCGANESAGKSDTKDAGQRTGGPGGTGGGSGAPGGGR